MSLFGQSNDNLLTSKLAITENGIDRETNNKHKKWP